MLTSFFEALGKSNCKFRCTLEPLYKTVHYKTDLNMTVLNIRPFKVDSKSVVSKQKCKDHIEK